MAVVSLTGTELKVYAGSVMHDYILSDFFGSNTMRHFGMTDSEDINMPIMLHGTAAFLDDDRDHTETVSSFVASDIDLFTPLKASNRVKKRTVQERPGLRHLENLGESHGRVVGKMKTQVIMSFLARQADSNGNTVEVDSTPLSGYGASLKTQLKTIAANMDELEVPAENRFCMMKSSAWYEIADLDGVMSVDFGGQADRQTLGGNTDIIKYINIPIMNVGIGFGTDFADSAYPTFPVTAEFDMTNVVALVWHKDTFAMREQVTPQTSIDWIPHLQVWQTLTRYQFGLKEMADPSSAPEGPATKGIWAIVDETSA